MSRINKGGKKKRKIAFVIGGRQTQGHFRPLMREIATRDDIDYEIIATNMHLLPEFGYSIEHVEGETNKVTAKIHNTLAGYNSITMVKSLGIFMLQLPETIEQMGVDMILIAGDRGEHLVGATVGAHMNIPVAHIQAGEVSGNIDGMTRHAISKYAHIHFAPNEDAAQRLRNMGEEEFRIFNFGAPQLDDLIGGHITSENEIYKKFNLNKKEPIILFLQHSVTEEVLDTRKQIEASLEAISNPAYQVVMIMNNSDAGGNIIHRAITEYRQPYMQLHKNLKREDYLGLMKVADVMVGNSSSGIIESPVMKLAAVNIGNRQRNRVRSSNVIDVGHNAEEIRAAIKQCLSPDFKKIVANCESPYGDGKSGKRIVDLLASVKIDEKLLTKTLTY